MPAWWAKPGASCDELFPCVMTKTRRRRDTDATRLTFPLQLVILIATSSATAAVSIWGSQSGLRSDVRDIRTRMELQVEVDRTQAKLEEERAAALKEAIAAMQRRQELQQYELQSLKESLLKNTQPRSTK